MFSRLIVLANLILNLVAGARILCVYNVPSISHQVVFRVLTQELARIGHELVVITPDPYLPKSRPPDNVREIDVSIAYETFRRGMAGLATSTGIAAHDLHEIVIKSIHDSYDTELEVPKVKELIQNKSEHFDLLIIESVTRGPFFFTHRFKNTPVIGFNSLMGLQFNYYALGAPVDPLLYPGLLHTKPYLNLWETFKAVMIEWYEIYSYWKSAGYENSIGKKHFGEDTPDIRELTNNMDLLFLNVNPIWDGVRPVPPSIVYVGGLHLKKPKLLPEEMKKYLDSCKKGVIYMSLGTNVKSSDLPLEKIKVFQTVFGKLPFCVLWKWENDEMANKTNNVRIEKWFPQADILGHPNVLVFITQGGLQSTDEAIDRGTPLIGIPFLGDQEKNVEKFEQYGIGKSLHLNDITEELLENTIVDITQNKSYRENIGRLKGLMSDQPSGALERAVWWVEYVLRHGGARHLRAPAAGTSLGNMSYPLLAALVAAALSLLVHFVSALRALFKVTSAKTSEKRKSD